MLGGSDTATIFIQLAGAAQVVPHLSGPKGPTKWLRAMVVGSFCVCWSEKWGLACQITAVRVERAAIKSTPAFLDGARR